MAGVLKVRLSKCSISSSEISAVKKVLESEYLGMGLQVLEFEQSIKQYLDTDMDVMCVNTGTSALQLALSALDIGPGDEVLVPSLTYVASFQAISAIGAKPVACEVNKETLFIDIRDAKRKITSKTRVIMPVHYASSSKGMSAVYALAQEYKLRVIEDAAQAFGCERDGKKIGTSGDVICFSFDGIKNITSGEGGAVLTNDKKVAQRLKDDRLLGVQKDTEMRYNGQRSWDFDVYNQGFRFHMSNINAAIGIEQMIKLPTFLNKRRANFESLNSLLRSKNGFRILPQPVDNIRISSHYCMGLILDSELSTNRTEIMNQLRVKGIGTSIYYPHPVPHMTYYKKKYGDITCPNAESISNSIIALPVGPHLESSDMQIIADGIFSVLSVFK